MHSKCNIDGHPYKVVATSEDGAVAEVFGARAYRTQWFDGLVGDYELVGEHDGLPVLLPPEEAAVFKGRHGLV